MRGSKAARLRGGDTAPVLSTRTILGKNSSVSCPEHDWVGSPREVCVGGAAVRAVAVPAVGDQVVRVVQTALEKASGCGWVWWELGLFLSVILKSVCVSMRCKIGN